MSEVKKDVYKRQLPGMCAALFALPVIGVPLSGKNLDGMDAVFSIMQMPPGVPVEMCIRDSVYPLVEAQAQRNR